MVVTDGGDGDGGAEKKNMVKMGDEPLRQAATDATTRGISCWCSGSCSYLLRFPLRANMCCVVIVVVVVVAVGGGGGGVVVGGVVGVTVDE